MHFIDIESNKVKNALIEHKNGLYKQLLSRNKKYRAFPEQVLRDNLEELLIGDPKRLIKLTEMPELRIKSKKHFTKIEKVFKYSGWFDNKKISYCAYHLADNLQINTCVYCNRIYTKTVIQNKEINGTMITRPQFDHWFPQEKFPLFSLSFFNLIPSCYICNSSIKGRKPMELNTHLHPYIKQDINMTYSYDLISHNTYQFKIKENNNRKVKNTIEFFKLKEIYETHIDEIEDLVKIKKLYSSSYLKNLKSILKETKISNEEIYRLAFGVYLNEEDFEKRPLSRMKNDLLTELRII